MGFLRAVLSRNGSAADVSVCFEDRNDENAHSRAAGTHTDQRVRGAGSVHARGALIICTLSPQAAVHRYMKVMPIMLFAGGLFFAFTGSTAPRILTEPLSQAANPSSNVTFAAAGSGIPPLRFQWFGNGAALSGKTNPVCVLTNLQSTDAGYYSVVVSDSSGSVTSRLARLELISGFTRII